MWVVCIVEKSFWCNSNNSSDYPDAKIPEKDKKYFVNSHRVSFTKVYYNIESLDTRVSYNAAGFRPFEHKKPNITFRILRSKRETPIIIRNKEGKKVDKILT